MSRLKGPAEFLAGEARKFQVQDHHARRLLAKAFQAGDSVGCNLHLQRIRLKEALQSPLHWAAVFHHQDGIHAILTPLKRQNMESARTWKSLFPR